ncbi:MAG: hypothetical protein ACOCSP_01755 [archaeon]
MTSGTKTFRHAWELFTIGAVSFGRRCFGRVPSLLVESACRSEVLLAGVLVVRVEVVTTVENVDRVAGVSFADRSLSLDPLREH